MKYFHKLFFSILLILTLAVTAVESAAVSFSLENSFSREKTKQIGIQMRHEQDTCINSFLLNKRQQPTYRI